MRKNSNKKRIGEYFGGPVDEKKQDTIYRGVCYFISMGLVLISVAALILSVSSDTKIKNQKFALITDKTMELCYTDLTENSTTSNNFSHIPSEIRNICNCVDNNNSTYNASTQIVKSTCVCTYINEGCLTVSYILYCNDNFLLKQLC